MTETSETSELQLGFLIHGRVQGVGYRWWACRTAAALGLRGTVRNLPDGSVEVHVAGPPDPVTRFATALSAGPPLARVARVDDIPSVRPLPPDFRPVF